MSCVCRQGIYDRLEPEITGRIASTPAHLATEQGCDRYGIDVIRINDAENP
jgi:hypothetical protein